MNVLIACERSGVVRRAFRERGHNAFSVDLCPVLDGGLYHFQGDALRVARLTRWDMIIAHPECRYLCNSGVLRLYKKGKKANGRDEDRWQKMEEAAEFYKAFLDLDVERLCIENSVMHGYGKKLIGDAPDTIIQTIQPWQFGEDASKRTRLQLRGLPKLIPTDVIVKDRYANQTQSGQNKLGPSPERSALRAQTYPGIACAMAEQWGCL